MAVAAPTRGDIVAGSRWRFTDDHGKATEYTIPATVMLGGVTTPSIVGGHAHLVSDESGKVAGVTFEWLLGHKGPGTWELIR